ncbi:FxsA family protein [Haladaptatus sp. T7]|uniref:FxsA family protein n=1 Tax=Haladaptatus sp. T7 TaxID=2029368 RepID=UPI0021A253B9|nr:FxsA family protein [Haladaptatus sp. T7]GKZ13064.1 membrane protein FxsA [Haladaptatus sp. T7]
MWKRLLALLLLIPLLDGLFLIFVASQIGWMITVALVVLTALIGMMLVRAEGRHTIRRIQTDLARGDAPTNRIIDGGFLLVSGAFLLTPGLITDTLGFLFALPPTRAVFRTVAKKWVITPYLDKQTGGFATGNVYTFGFPNGGNVTGTGNSGNTTSSTGSGGDTYRVDSDAYDIDFDDDSEEKGNP